jgi:acetyl esterase/lipase
MQTLLALTIITTAATLFVSPSARAAEDDAAIEFKENQVYGTAGDEKLTLHLALPTAAEGPRPALVFIHGGGWRAGDKDVLKDAIKEAASRGYVAVSVGYRLVPKHRFPAPVHDVKCAVRWLRAHASELNVDPDRIGAIGFSAGAHLAMMLGTVDTDDGLEGDEGWPEYSSKVQAVVSYFGPTNLLVELPVVSRPLVVAFLDGEVEERREAYVAASPITYVDAEDAPMLLLQGTKDPLVPYDQAFQMATALTKAGVRGRVELILGAGHGWAGDEHQRTVELSYDFFEKWLKAPDTSK